MVSKTEWKRGGNGARMERSNGTDGVMRYGLAGTAASTKLLIGRARMGGTGEMNGRNR